MFLNRFSIKLPAVCIIGADAGSHEVYYLYMHTYIHTITQGNEYREYTPMKNGGFTTGAYVLPNLDMFAVVNCITSDNRYRYMMTSHVVDRYGMESFVGGQISIQTFWYSRLTA